MSAALAGAEMRMRVKPLLLLRHRRATTQKTVLAVGRGSWVLILYWYWYCQLSTWAKGVLLGV